MPICSTTLPGIGGRAKDSMRGYGLWSAASCGVRPGGMTIASSSGRDGRLWARRARLITMEDGVRELMVKGSMISVTAWCGGMAPGTDRGGWVGSCMGLVVIVAVSVNRD